MAKAFLFVVLALAAGVAAKQVPVGDMGDLPITLGEIMAQIEQQAPIDDIIAMCEQLLNRTQDAMTQRLADHERLAYMNCGYAAKQLVIDASQKKIDDANFVIYGHNSTVDGYTKEPDGTIAILKQDIVDVEDDIVATDVPAMQELGQNRETAYKIFLVSRDILTWSLDMLDAFRRMIAGTELDQYASESTTSVAGDAARTNFDAAANASFVQKKKRIVTYLKAQAPEDPEKAAFVEKAAETVARAEGMDQIYSFIYQLRNDLTSDLEATNLNEQEAYKLFVETHKDQRTAVNDKQQIIAGKKMQIAKDVEIVANLVRDIATQSGIITDEEAIITAAQAEYNQEKYMCDEETERFEADSKRFQDEQDTLNELIAKLKSVQLSDYQSGVADRVSGTDMPASSGTDSPRMDLEPPPAA